MFNDWVERLRPFSQVFHRNGKRVFLVGGAIRNRLLGRPADDFDFATDATPQQVMAMFRRVIPTGLQHGTVTVMQHGEAFEVTTFRLDGQYSDHRHPVQVSFTSDLEQDLGRRDFTINAMALDLEAGGLIDLFGGQDDLKKKCLRAIGDPEQRFEEDALRILRLFRFASQLGFSIEPESLEAAVKRRDTVRQVSRERIRDEWLKLWGADAVPEVWTLMDQLGFVTMLAHPLDPSSCPMGVLETWKNLDTLQRVSVWLVACCRNGQHEKFLRELRLSNQQISEVLAPLDLVAALDGDEPVVSRAKRTVSRWGGREWIDPALGVLGALLASGIVSDRDGLSGAMTRLIGTTEPLLLRELAVSGTDLIRAGVAPGPQMGAALQRLLELVWQDPSLNDRSKLLDRLQ